MLSFWQNISPPRNPKATHFKNFQMILYFKTDLKYTKYIYSLG